MAQNIPKDFIDNLLEKVNIVDVIGNYIKLEKKGNDYWARCPFHSEKTSSFSVSENKQFFHCFGCGAHGNSIGFVMDHSNKTYPEAIETIANSLGIEIPRDKESTKKFEAKKIIQNSLEDAKKQFEKQLKNSEKAISYLKDRNISGETAKLFNIGYADDNFQALIKNLEKKYTELNLLDAGLIVKKENKTYDKFRHRIMFPIHDVSGKTIAFGGRIIEENLKIPAAKYMNSPETPLFSKKKVLYNLNLAKQTKESRESLYVVEGYMDVIALHQADIKNTVATLGTAVTQENLLQCFKYTKEIICCFDGDQAGKKAAWQGVENIMPIIKDGDVISFVFLPEGKDPDNIVNKGGKNHWNELVNKKISLEDFIYNKFSSESDINTAAGKTQYIQKVDKLLDKLNAKILKTIISNSLKEKVGAKYIIDNKGNEIIQKRKITKSASPLQKAILILMHNPNIEVDESIVNDSRIEKNQGIIILKSIIKLIKNDNNINMGRILEKFRHESDHYKILEQISRISITNYEFPGKEFHACICLTIKNYLKEKLQESDPSDIKKSAKIQQEIREIDDKSKKF
jgi:DNA primase|tara:strand:- start:6637 stop:8349 length:1713 start_codon:yes stop_codon:yes gene_type:complete